MLLDAEGASLHFFFPDALHEVTQDVEVSRTPNGVSFKYITPPLAGSSQQTFRASVYRQDPNHRRLEAIRDKLAMRLVALSNARAKLSRHAEAEESASFEALQQSIAAVSQRITATLAGQVVSLADAQLPIQVGNVPCQAGYSSSVLHDVRLTAASSLGSAIEGEHSKVVVEARQLPGPQEANDELRANQVVLRVLWNGTVVQETAARSLSTGPITASFVTPKLMPGSASVCVAEVYHWNSSKHSKAGRFGFVKLPIPVAPDSVAPTWMSNGTPDIRHPVVQTAQPVFATVQDGFGLIDESSIAASSSWSPYIDLTGISSPTVADPNYEAIQVFLSSRTADGKFVTTDITSRLTVTLLDDSTYQISGDLNPIPEGIYAFTLTARDLAGNAAIAKPASVIFVVDRTPPKLGDLQPAPGSTLNLAAFVVSGRADEPLSLAAIGGQPLSLSSDGKSFSGSVHASTSGPLSLLLETVDYAGNKTSSEWSITIPPSATDDVSMPIPSGQSLVEIKLHAANSPSAALTNVFLDVSAISITDDAGADWTLVDVPTQVDLVPLLTGTRATLTAGTAPAGHYTSLRINIGTNSRLVSGGQRVPLIVDHQRISMPIDVNLREGRVSSVQIELDLARSLPELTHLDPVLLASSTESFTQAQLAKLRGLIGTRLDAMIARADTIVQATATGVQYRRGVTRNGNPMLFTDVSLALADSMKGSPQPPGTLGLVVPGGHEGALTVAVTHMPAFAPNDESILFLKTVAGQMMPLPDGKVRLP